LEFASAASAARQTKPPTSPTRLPASNQLDIYLDKGYMVAVMSNYDPPAAQRIADKAKALINQE
jgi:hypothetical protein